MGEGGGWRRIDGENKDRNMYLLWFNYDSNQFELYFPLFLIMIMNMKQ